MYSFILQNIVVDINWKYDEMSAFDFFLRFRIILQNCALLQILEHVLYRMIHPLNE